MGNFTESTSVVTDQQIKSKGCIQNNTDHARGKSRTAEKAKGMSFLDSINSNNVYGMKEDALFMVGT